MSPQSVTSRPEPPWLRAASTAAAQLPIAFVISRPDDRKRFSVTIDRQGPQIHARLGIGGSIEQEPAVEPARELRGSVGDRRGTGQVARAELVDRDRAPGDWDGGRRLPILGLQFLAPGVQLHLERGPFFPRFGR